MRLSLALVRVLLALGVQWRKDTGSPGVTCRPRPGAKWKRNAFSGWEESQRLGGHRESSSPKASWQVPSNGVKSPLLHLP